MSACEPCVYWVSQPVKSGPKVDKLCKYKVSYPARATAEGATSVLQAYRNQRQNFQSGQGAARCRRFSSPTH